METLRLRVSDSSEEQSFILSTNLEYFVKTNNNNINVNKFKKSYIKSRLSSATLLCLIVHCLVQLRRTGFF